MQLTIRMPDDQMAKIEEMAKETGVKKSELVRLAIRRFLEEADAQEGWPYSKVRDLLGIASSGVPDLGTDHRRHLLNRIRRDKA